MVKSTYTNDRGLERLGLSRAEFFRIDSVDLVHPDDKGMYARRSRDRDAEQAWLA
jgi:hypothetical protein